MYLFLRERIADLSRKKELEFRNQFKDCLQAFASSLHVGYSVENTIREAFHDLKHLYSANSRILIELRKMIYQLDMLVAVEYVLEDFSCRVQQEDVHDFIAIFSSAKKMGGDSIQILRNAILVMGEKIDIEQEIQVMLTAKKLEFKIMCLIPLGIILYMRLTFPVFIESLYGNAIGITLMTVCLLAYIWSYRMGKRLTDIQI